MTKLIDKILSCIYPTKCIFCKKIISPTLMQICNECIDNIPYNEKYCRLCGSNMDIVFGDTICPSCRNKRKPYKRVYAPLIYKGVVRESIISFKYRGKQSYAKTFATIIFTHLKESGYMPDVITYVPIHFLRKNKRGYNQSELIARQLARFYSVPCIKLLKKTRYTSKLAKLTMQERQKTVKNTYMPTLKDFTGKQVLLVDDIVTTTSTITECSRVLKKSYGCDITVAAIAATHKKKHDD